MATFLLLIPDLMFNVRVTDTLRALGHTPHDVADADALLAAARNGASAIVIDGQARTPWQNVVHTLKSDPTTVGIKILAFGSHVDVAAQRRAVDAGCDRVVTRGKFARQMPQLLQALVTNVPNLE